jgi:hypothetical protein
MPDTHWATTGNDATNPFDNFLGTTDERPLVLKTNGIEALRITSGRRTQVNGFSRAGGNIGIGTDQPVAKLHVESGGHFSAPQVRIVQTTVDEFARLRFDSFGIDPDDPDNKRPFPAWDIAAGRGVLNFFVPSAGNILSLSSDGVASVAILQITGGGDVAESFAVEEGTPIEPGTVMVIDDQSPGKLKISEHAYDRKVAGVVSGAGRLPAGLSLARDLGNPHDPQVALAGRVYCKAEAFSAPIEPGCLMTTSHLPGHAMKAADLRASQGAILGKSMSSLPAGTGLVLMLVNLQ